MPLVRISINLHDLWVGVYWRRIDWDQPGRACTEVYICIIPALPILINWERRWQ